MDRLTRNPFALWTWRSLAGLALLFGLVLGPAAHAASDTNRITLYAPDAPAGAWTSVQFQTPDGTWHDVAGWQGDLDTYPDSGLRYKTWAVADEDADEGPFRWAVYTKKGGTLWGVSDSFKLPGGVNVNLEATAHAFVGTTITTSPAATPTPAAPVAVPSTDVTSALPVTSDASTWYFDCLGCKYGRITAYLPDAPLGSTVSVEYQTPDNVWHLVPSWQTTLTTNTGGTPFVQWSVGAANFGQGPFRWVVTQPDGKLWGVSAKFKLPNEGVDQILFLLRK